MRRLLPNMCPPCSKNGSVLHIYTYAAHQPLRPLHRKPARTSPRHLMTHWYLSYPGHGLLIYACMPCIVVEQQLHINMHTLHVNHSCHILNLCMQSTLLTSGSGRSDQPAAQCSDGGTIEGITRCGNPIAPHTVTPDATRLAGNTNLTTERELSNSDDDCSHSDSERPSGEGTEDKAAEQLG